VLPCELPRATAHREARMSDPMNCPGVDVPAASTLPTIADIADSELLRRAVHNARDRFSRRGQKHPRWTAVQNVFALGSTFSHQLCRRFDLDPDEEVSR